MSQQPDSTGPTVLDLPGALHKLAAHIAEHPIPHPYSIAPEYDGALAVTFHQRDFAAAMRFAGTLTGPLRVSVVPHDGSEACPPFMAVTVHGDAMGLSVQVVVMPHVVEGDTVDSMRARVDSELAATGEPAAARAVTA